MSSPKLSVVNEGTTAYLTVAFYDKTDVLAAPTTINYRVDDLASGTNIVASTAVGSPASSVEITLTAAANAILDSLNEYEVRVVTITASYGAGGQVQDQYRYRVRNLGFV